MSLPIWPPQQFLQNSPTMMRQQSFPSRTGVMRQQSSPAFFPATPSTQVHPHSPPRLVPFPAASGMAPTLPHMSVPGSIRAPTGPSLQVSALSPTRSTMLTTSPNRAVTPSRSGSLVKTAVSPSGATTLTPASFQASFSPRATLVASPPRRLESNTPVSRTQSSPNMLAHQSSMPAVVLTAQDASLQASQVHRCEHVDVPNGVPIIAAAMPATALGPSSFDSSCEDICIRSPGNSPSKAVLSTASPGSTDLQFFSPDTSPSKTTPAILNTSPRSNAASQLDIADVTFQSGGSVSSTTRSQGIATCALCHALLHYSVGQHNFQVLLASSTLPGVSPDLIDRLVTGQSTEADQALISSTLCRFHKSHMNRYDLWTRTHANVKLRTAAAPDIALQSVANAATVGDDLAQMEAEVRQASPSYLEGVSQYVKQLQGTLRGNIAASWYAKAQSFIDYQQNQFDEDEDHMNKKMGQRRSQMNDNLSRFEKEVRADFWQDQARKKRRPQIACAEKGQNMATWKTRGYTDDLRQMAALEEVRQSLQLRAEKQHVASKVERRREQKEKQLDVWSAKVEHLLLLHEGQAGKDCTRLLERVDKKLKKLEEEQMIDFRRIIVRYKQHISRIQNVLEKTRRGHSLRVHHSSARPESGATEMLSFVHCVMRSELSVPTDFSRRSGVRSESSRQTDLDVGGNTLELSAFAEFLGARFPSLSAAFSMIDLTRSGHITGFELNTWMVLYSCPGEASLVFKHLDRQRCGSVDFSGFSVLSCSFLHAGLRLGRPAGMIGSTALSKVWSVAARGQEIRPTKVADTFLLAAHLTHRILSFLTRSQQYDTMVDLSFANMSVLSSASSPSKLIEDACAAKSHERARSQTDIGRWAQVVAGSGLLDRHAHMQCGRPRSHSRNSTPKRSSSPNLLRRRSRDWSASQGSEEWSRNLRRSDSLTRSLRTSRRGAPPPKTGLLLDDGADEPSTTISVSKSCERLASPKPSVSSASPKEFSAVLEASPFTYSPSHVERLVSQESLHAMEASPIIRVVENCSSHSDAISLEGAAPAAKNGRPIVVRYVPQTVARDLHEVSVPRAIASNGLHTPPMGHQTPPMVSTTSSPALGQHTILVPSSNSSQPIVLTPLSPQRFAPQQASNLPAPAPIMRL